VYCKGICSLLREATALRDFATDGWEREHDTVGRV